MLSFKHTFMSQFMSSLVLIIVLLILPCTVSPTWFYLCHHIKLSGGKSHLMTQRLCALCFGLPVNARRASGISPHKPSLSVYNNLCILLLSTDISKHDYSKSVLVHSLTLLSKRKKNLNNPKTYLKCGGVFVQSLNYAH